MARTQLSTTRQGPRNVWDATQRYMLLLLKDNSDLEWPQRLSIFNDIFQNALRGRGFEDGLDGRKLQAQCAGPELERPGWQLVIQPPTTAEEEQLRSDLKFKVDTLIAAKTLHSPPTSPNTSRKRARPDVPPRPSVNDDEDNRNNDSPAHGTRKRQRTLDIERFSYSITTEAVVSTPRTPRQVRSPITPRSSQASTIQRKKAREGANVEYKRYDGTRIWLYQYEADESMLDLVDPSEESVKPPLPPLLFRYWDNNSQGLNSRDRFVCGRFKNAMTRPRPAPAVADIEWNDFGDHIDHRTKPTPFISTSSMLVWVVKKAMTAWDAGERSGHISVIDTYYLDDRSVYWVPPLHAALAKKRVFRKGGFQYKGSAEHLVWHEITEEAILSTFSIQELMRQAKTPVLNKFLRLGVLATGTVDKLKVNDRLKGTQLPLSKNVDVLAQMVLFFDLGDADYDKMWCICYELIRGWELHIDRQDWATLATAFTHAVCRRRTEPASLQDQATLMAAFTSAVQWSLGAANARYKPKEIAKLQRKASRIGLESPKDIVAKVLTKAQSALEAFSARRPRLPAVERRQREVVAIEGGESEDEIVVASEDVVMSDDVVMSEDLSDDVIRVAGDEEIVYGSESEDEDSH
nr:hypothetical protein B0A51_12399 [Rachicladosporium sp. CCFEE 5018]